MVNLHLLKLQLTITDYIVAKRIRNSSDPTPYLNQLPAYTIARCPYCLAAISERLDTYSVQGWSRSYGKSVYHPYAVLNHCEHFTLVEPFFHFHGIWPDEAKGMFGPEKPHVIGTLLESGKCLAVIHALPVCRIENDTFVPRYTLFMISYFSEQPENAYDTVINFNRRYTDEPYTPFPFAEPPYDAPQWWDLCYWGSQKLLFWLDSNDPDLPLKSGDCNSFPYGNIEGRRFSHGFPYPLPKSYDFKR